MNKYLLLYSGGSMPQGEEEQKLVTAAWEKWMGANAAALVDGGNPFTPMAKTINSNGQVSDGVGAMASGYSLIQADSLDAAVAIARTCPVLMGGAKISVFETFDVMGM